MKNLELLSMVRQTLENTLQKALTQELKVDVIFNQHNERLREIDKLVKLEPNRKNLIKQKSLVTLATLTNKSKTHYSTLAEAIKAIKLKLPSAIDFM